MNNSKNQNTTNSKFLNFTTMKNYILYSFILLTGLLFNACSDDDTPPAPVDEEEVITTLMVTLTSNTGQTITLNSQDLDGDGPNDPTISVSAPLRVATTYTGVIELLNETENPAEPIHEEVAAESNAHQFFFTQSANLGLTTQYLDFDGNGNPLGLSFSLSTTSAGQGTMTFTLRHEPLKPNDGTLSGAGGETDLSVTFPITVE